jgi:hypothetical protein
MLSAKGCGSPHSDNPRPQVSSTLFLGRSATRVLPCSSSQALQVLNGVGWHGWWRKTKGTPIVVTIKARGCRIHRFDPSDGPDNGSRKGVESCDQ